MIKEDKILNIYDEFMSNPDKYRGANPYITQYIRDRLDLKYTEVVVGVLKKNKRYPVMIPDIFKSELIEKYCEGVSVSELLDEYGVVGRPLITKHLKDVGVHVSINSEVAKKFYARKIEKSEKTCLDKHGVRNIGMLRAHGYAKLNKIEYSAPEFLSTDLKNFSAEVWRLTRKNLKNVSRPRYCEYTGIAFADEPCNPNDPAKSSIDHLVSIVVAFFNGHTAESTADLKNIKFCLKYVNGIKGMTTYESFMPIALKIRKHFIDAGYSHN